MHPTTKKHCYCYFGIPALMFSIFSSSQSFAETPQFQLGGKITLSHLTNGYEKTSYKSERSNHWTGTLSARVSEDHLFYLSGGGYQQLEDKTGTYLTDTVLGYTQPELFNIGDNTASSLNLQFTVPTSETSQKQELITALRLTVPLSYRDGNWSASVAPRLRKNLHQYTTAGGKALTSWISSLHLSSSYSFYDFTLSGSLLGGTSWSYEGTRRNWDYGGSAALSYQAMKNLAASLSVSTSGVYYDAERGTLGNIDLFDERKATYTMSLIFSF